MCGRFIFVTIITGNKPCATTKKFNINQIWWRYGEDKCMYPTNYMNPMNNQPMSPDYGYNRMQQVQQMQQAINPTVPNMFGQMNQMNNMNQQQQTPYISAIPVTCLDEAKAARISFYLW